MDGIHNPSLIGRIIIVAKLHMSVRDLKRDAMTTRVFIKLVAKLKLPECLIRRISPAQVTEPGLTKPH